MFSDGLFQYMHRFVTWLEWPVVAGLMVVIALAIWETGCSIGEYARGLGLLERRDDVNEVEQTGRLRIERADLIARVGPMLGLMGTLIPLGPGIAALSQGDLHTLAAAVTTAFDTTVMGLLAGVFGFVIGRLRRRWYDRLLERLEGASS